MNVNFGAFAQLSEIAQQEYIARLTEGVKKTQAVQAASNDLVRYLLQFGYQETELEPLDFFSIESNLSSLIDIYTNKKYMR